MMMTRLDSNMKITYNYSIELFPVRRHRSAPPRLRSRRVWLRVPLILAQAHLGLNYMVITCADGG